MIISMAASILLTTTRVVCMRKRCVLLITWLLEVMLELTHIGHILTHTDARIVT